MSGSVYFGCNKVSFQPGTRDAIYRQQPGHILYAFGDCQQDELLGFHVWSDRKLFDSLPQDPNDLEKLSQCRQPFMETIAAPPMRV